MRAAVVLEEWVEALEVEGRARATCDAYRRHVADTLGEIASQLDVSFEELECGALTRARLRRAVLSYQERGDLRGAGGSEGRARSSVQARLAALRGFSQWCVDEGYLEQLLTQGVRGGAGRSEVHAAPARLGREGARGVLEAARGGRNPVRDELVCVLMLELGLSAREVAKLEVGDVSERGGTRRITVEAKRARGGERVRRELELPSASRVALEAWLEERERVLTRRGVSSEWLVVTRQDEASVESRARAVAAAVERALGRAGEAGRSHRLRATHVQLSLEAGASIPEVSARTGVVSLPALKAMLGEDSGAVGARSLL